MRKTTTKKIKRYVRNLASKARLSDTDPEMKKTYRQVKKFMNSIDKHSRAVLLLKMDNNEDIPLKGE